MLAASNEVNLLSLPDVLFPGTFLPVQITDPHHRRLLRCCQQDNTYLGAVLASNDSDFGRAVVPCVTGCLASVAVLLYEDTDDKPCYVVLYGEQRFRVREIIQHDQFTTGRVDLLTDHVGHTAARRHQQAGALFRTYLNLIDVCYATQTTTLQFPADPTQASYLLASVLTLPTTVKQRCLEADSADFRLGEALHFLQAECEKLRVLLLLSQHTHQRYTLPDAGDYTALVSLN